MVETPRKTVRSGPLKPINQPEVVKLEEDGEGIPVALRGEVRHPIKAVDEQWRIDDEWWCVEPVSRTYYAVRLLSGQKLILFKDLVSGSWYRQSY